MCMSGMGGILSGVVGAMGAVVEYNAQVDDFNRSEKMWQENYTNSLTAAREEQVALQTRAHQEMMVTSQKFTEIGIEEAEKKATAEVSAASAGVGGLGVKGLIRNIGRHASRNRYWVRENAAVVSEQISQELKATNTRLLSRINSVVRPQKPNPAGAMLKIMGGFVSALG